MCGWCCLKEIEAGGLCLLHQLGSAKGRELESAGKAAFVMHWKSSAPAGSGARGIISREEGPQADEYYASRSLKSRLGAWASRQSEPLSSRTALMAEVAKVTAEHGPNPETSAVLGRVPPRSTGDRILGGRPVPVA